MTAFDEAWGLVKTEEPLDLHPGFTRSGHHGKDMVHPWRWTKGDDADFHVQLKGNNAGKVLKEPIPNSIGVATNPNVLLPDFARYMFEHIHILRCDLLQRLLRCMNLHSSLLILLLL